MGNMEDKIRVRGSVLGSVSKRHRSGSERSFQILDEFEVRYELWEAIISAHRNYQLILEEYAEICPKYRRLILGVSRGNHCSSWFVWSAALPGVLARLW